MVAEHKKSQPTGRWLLAGLVALNVALGAAVYLRAGDNIAMAQMARPIDLQVVSGKYTINNSPSVLYMFDANSGQLVVVKPSLNGGNAVILGRQNVIEIFEKMR